MVRSKPPPGEGQEFDYVEAVNSASSVSTPPDDPFASDSLGETVIKVDKAVTHKMYTLPENDDSGFTVPVLGPVKTDSTLPFPAQGLVRNVDKLTSQISNPHKVLIDKLVTRNIVLITKQIVTMLSHRGVNRC